MGEIDVEDPQGDDGLEHPHDDRNHPSDHTRLAGSTMFEVPDQFSVSHDPLILRQLSPDLRSTATVGLCVDDLVRQHTTIVGRTFEFGIGGDHRVERFIGPRDVRLGPAPALVDEVGEAVCGHDALEVGGTRGRVVAKPMRACPDEHCRELPGDRARFELAGRQELSIVGIVSGQVARDAVRCYSLGVFRSQWSGEELAGHAALGGRRIDPAPDLKPLPSAVTEPTPRPVSSAPAASARCCDSAIAPSGGPTLAVRPMQSTAEYAPGCDMPRVGDRFELCGCHGVVDELGRIGLEAAARQHGRWAAACGLARW